MGDALGGLSAFWMAAMDFIDKVIKARRGHRYLHVAAEAGGQRPFRHSAVSPQTGIDLVAVAGVPAAREGEPR